MKYNELSRIFDVYVFKGRDKVLILTSLLRSLLSLLSCSVRILSLCLYCYYNLRSKHINFFNWANKSWPWFDMHFGNVFPSESSCLFVSITQTDLIGWDFLCPQVHPCQTGHRLQKRMQIEEHKRELCSKFPFQADRDE